MSARFLGVAVPQANPTVEWELPRLLPRDSRTRLVTTRLTSSAPDSHDRLIDYFQQLDQALASFDTLPLAALGFACTGSCYLLGAEEEGRVVEGLAAGGTPLVVTATQAILSELRLRGVRRLAVLSPYPQALHQAGLAYWRRAGLEVVAEGRVEIGGQDTRRIYDLDDERVGGALESFDPGRAQALLLAGTGMPTLRALTRPPSSSPEPIPVLSSNLCLLFEILRRVSLWPADQPAQPPG